MRHRRIVLETIDYDKARIPGQEGDWFYDENGDLIIQIIPRDIIPNVRGDILATETFLFAIHELVEAKLCLDAGIDQESVDDFDRAFKGDGEAGDEPDAPYRQQHRRAMLIEHLMADWLGVSGYGTVE